MKQPRSPNDNASPCHGTVAPKQHEDGLLTMVAMGNGKASGLLQGQLVRLRCDCLIQGRGGRRWPTYRPLTSLQGTKSSLPS